MWVVGCTPSADDTGDPSSAAPSPEAAPTSPTRTEADTAAQRAGQAWDPTAWTPTVQVEPVIISEGEREAYYQDLVRRRAEDSGLTVLPDASLIAWASSPAEYGALRARCLQDAGFPAVSDGGAGVHFDPGIPAAQEEDFAAASYVCELQYPLDPRAARDWSDSQLALVYDYWDQYYIPCLEAHGHAVSRESQPSREVFVSSFNTQQRAAWWPSEAVTALSIDERRALATTCPELPPPAAMYGQ